MLKEHLKMLGRRIEAEHSLPPLSMSDSKIINFRSVLIERAGLGVERPSEHQLRSIRALGYDAFFVEKMNSQSRIGSRVFRKLASIRRLDLTTEYLVFHNFRDRLKTESRIKIASLLLKHAIR